MPWIQVQGQVGLLGGGWRGLFLFFAEVISELTKAPLGRGRNARPDR